MVLFRVLVTPSVLLLACIVVLQTIVYSIIQDVKFLMRHLAMIGEFPDFFSIEIEFERWNFRRPMSATS